MVIEERKNIFLTDANVNGPALRQARAWNAEIIRDVDIEVPCDIDDYDECLFYFAIENGNVLVTGDVKDFEWRFRKFVETGQDHPGMVLIPSRHQHSSYLIAKWLALLSDEDMTNRLEWIK